MNSETDIHNYEPHTLALNTFTPPTGYVLAGWCTVQDTNATSTNPQTTCDSESYRDGSTISSSPSISATDGGTLTLYAYWQRPYTMQQFANGTADTTCTKLNIGERVTLIDARDSQEYTVAKLKDNKCWMTKNLNIAGGTVLSSDTTDFVTDDPNYTLPTTNGWTTTDNGTKLVLPASSNAFGSTDNVARLYNSGNEEGCGTSGQNTPCYSYYSWDAATLGSGRNINTNNTDAPYSICPKGWRLPRTRNASATSWRTRSDFYMLAHQYGLDSTTSSLEEDDGFYMQAGPNTVPNFLLAGYYNSSSFGNGGSYGYYWSSTSNSIGSSARNLRFSLSDVYSSDGSNRRNGFSIRCLTEETVNDLTYMQDFASLTNDTKTRIINNMKTEEIYTLKDKRDNQDYTIAKLKDGKVWMTKNLNLAGGTALSSGDTDFTPDYTLPTTNGWTTTDNGTKLVLPASSRDFSPDSNVAKIYNSANGENCGDSGQSATCYSYYSWDAATLGSGRVISTNNINAPYSMCPKGWRLPTAYTTSAPNWQNTSDFYMLAHQYGLDNTTSTSESDSDFYTKAGPGTTPNFLLAGYHDRNSFYGGGSYGLYWSSTSHGDNDSAHYLYFSSLRLYSASSNYRRFGFSVRCLAK